MKKTFLFLSPLILFAEAYGFSWMVDLLRQQSDVAVFVGIALACGLVTGNYYLYKLIVKK